MDLRPRGGARRLNQPSETPAESVLPKALTPSELALLAEELDPLLADARIQRVHGPAPERFTLKLYGRGEKHTLMLALEARPLPRAHLVVAAPENPPSPGPFVQFLRREFEGALLRRVRAVPEQRILRFEAESFDGEKVQARTLVLELFGRKPGLYVLGDEDLVLSMLRNATEARGELKPGVRWTAPEEGAPPPKASDPASFAWLPEAPVPQADEPPLAPPPHSLSLSERLEGRLGSHEEAASEEQAEKGLTQALRKRLKKERRLHDKLEADLDQAAQAERLRREGELLKTHLGSIARGADAITLTDHTAPDGPEEVTITLDPARPPLEQMQARFREAKRRDKALPKLATRLAGAAERVEQLEALLAALDRGEEAEALHAKAVGYGFVSEGPKQPLPASGRRGKAPPEPRRPYRSFTSKDGLEILVGRTSSDNDELTFRVARGNDMWLHVADWPGSHVVIREAGEIPTETLLDAGLLAIHHSKAPKGSRQEVSYTRRKNVSKFRGANSGQVQLASRRSIRVKHDAERLDRLVNRPDAAR